MAGWPVCPQGAGRTRAGSPCTGHCGLDLVVMAVLDVGLAWCPGNDPHLGQILAARFLAARNLGDISPAGWAGVPPWNRAHTRAGARW